MNWSDDGLVRRTTQALNDARRELELEVRFHVFVQFLFFEQWLALKAYANDRGVRLMGDVPFYVAHDSADVWAARHYFALNERGQASIVGGVPPDAFAPEGQLWGNPVYRWEAHRQDDYAWWIARIRATFKLVDLLRLDHFRGFAAYWAVPAGEATAINGTWQSSPGDDLLCKLRDAMGELPIVAEDLGIITDDVTTLRQRHGLPGMKILQFAFVEGAEHYLPHTYTRDCVVYTGTHDTDTTRGWYAADGPDYAQLERAAIDRERKKARQYLGVESDARDITRDLMHLALSSDAHTAIVPMQDVLGDP